MNEAKSLKPPMWVWCIGAFAFVLHVVTNGRYGYFRDELYFIACGNHLAWGYVDQPPLTPFIAHLSQALSFGSLTLFRLPAAFAHSAVTILCGWLAVLLGGGTVAALIASVCALVSPLLLVNGHLLTMNAFEPVIWTGIAIGCVFIQSRSSWTLYLVVGLLIGSGLLNKHSTAFFAVALLLGILISKNRSRFSTKGIGLTAVIAFAVLLPHLVWQIQNHFPIIELLRNGQQGKNAEFHFVQFVLGVITENNPLTALIWISGLIFLISHPLGKRHQYLGLGWLFLFALFTILKAKVYYIAPAMPILFAAGAVGLQFRLKNSRRLLALVAVLLFASGSMLAPLVIPILSIDRLVAYQTWLGVRPQRSENKSYGVLPQHIADQFGWKEIVVAVDHAIDAIPIEDRKKLMIFTSNYGEAGAIELMSKYSGSVYVASSHNNYYLWGPKPDAEIWMVVGKPGKILANAFGPITEIGRSETNPYAMPYESGVSIFMAHTPRDLPLSVWPGIRNYN